MPINDLQRAAVTVYESEMKDYKANLLRYEQQQKARTPSRAGWSRCSPRS